MISVHEKLSFESDCIIILPDQISTNLLIMNFTLKLLPRFQTINLYASYWMYNFWKTFQPYFPNVILSIMDNKMSNSLSYQRGLIINFNQLFKLNEELFENNLIISSYGKSNLTLVPDEKPSNNERALLDSLKSFLNLFDDKDSSITAEKLIDYHFQEKSKINHVSVFCRSNLSYFILGLKFGKIESEKIKIYSLENINKEPLKYENVLNDFYHVLNIAYCSLLVYTDDDDLFNLLSLNKVNIEVRKLNKYPFNFSVNSLK